jgi:D-amino peptidase
VKVFLITDMEGLAGVDRWEQCYDPDDESPAYREGCRHLIADTNAAVEGFFNGGATEVFVVDGHGRNRDQALRSGALDSRAQLATSPWFAKFDATIGAIGVIGQHAMAGTRNGFLDHTQSPRTICRLSINGEEHGELSQLAACAGHYGCPLAFASGDEALCAEARRLFPWCRTVATKRGTGWGSCELYPAEDVRNEIQTKAGECLRQIHSMKPWAPALPAEVVIEWAWSGLADLQCEMPGTRRISARKVAWTVTDSRDFCTIPFPQFDSKRPAPAWLSF